MIFTTFGRLGRPSSLVGFGCAPLGSRYGKSESLRALANAFDQGVNYFDVARAYGYGDAEEILGSFIRGRRDQVIVATKFGIEPPVMTPARRFVKAVTRNVFRVAPGLRRAVRRRLGNQFARRRFDRDQAARSLDESLRQLRTDRVDVFLVHDCTLEALADGGLFDFLEGLVATGKALTVGVSGDRKVVEQAVRQRPGIAVAQFHHDLFQPAVSDVLRASPRLASVGFQTFGGERGVARLRNVIRVARNDAGTPAELRRKLRAAKDDDAIAALALSGARIDGGLSVLLATMFTSAHIQANVRAISSAMFTPDEVRHLHGVGQRETAFMARTTA